MRFKSAYGPILLAIEDCEGISKLSLKQKFPGWPKEHFEKALSWLIQKGQIRETKDSLFRVYPFEVLRHD